MGLPLSKQETARRIFSFIQEFNRFSSVPLNNRRTEKMELTPICGAGSKMPEFDDCWSPTLKGVQTQSMPQFW
jgi:hypothetical protein